MKRVLLVDDDDTMLFAFRKLCKASGVSAETADSLDTAVRLLARERFDIIFSDLNLTGDCEQEGLEVIRAAKRYNPSIRAFIWSAYDEENVHDKDGTADIEGYLTKPVKFDALLSIINAQAVVGAAKGG